MLFDIEKLRTLNVRSEPSEDNEGSEKLVVELTDCIEKALGGFNPETKGVARFNIEKIVSIKQGIEGESFNAARSKLCAFDKALRHMERAIASLKDGVTGYKALKDEFQKEFASKNPSWTQPKLPPEQVEEYLFPLEMLELKVSEWARFTDSASHRLADHKNEQLSLQKDFVCLLRDLYEYYKGHTAKQGRGYDPLLIELIRDAFNILKWPTPYNKKDYDLESWLRRVRKMLQK